MPCIHFINAVLKRQVCGPLNRDLALMPSVHTNSVGRLGGGNLQSSPTLMPCVRSFKQCCKGCAFGHLKSGPALIPCDDAIKQC